MAVLNPMCGHLRIQRTAYYRQGVLSPPRAEGGSAAGPPTSAPPPPTSRPPGGGADGLSATSAAYTAAMAAAMPGPPLTYDHEAGMNWTVLPSPPFPSSVIVGSCPQMAADVARLAAEAGVTAIVSLQEDADLEHFGIDGNALAVAAQEAGLTLFRVPVKDFDPISLRASLPRAVAVLEAALASRGGTVYVHCTAGLGRAPAVALAHAAWVQGERLAECAAALRAVRPCNPRLAAIRGAGADLVLGPGALVQTTVRIAESDLPPGTASVAVAGLDAGWSGRLAMAKTALSSASGDRQHAFWSLTRPLPPGRHPFKLVVNGSEWRTAPGFPTIDEGGHANSVLEVLPPAGGGGVAAFTRRRLLDDEMLPDEAAAAAAAVRALAAEAVPAAEAAGRPRTQPTWLVRLWRWWTEVGSG